MKPLKSLQDSGQAVWLDAVDLPIPGHRASFGTVKAAQARGDFEVLLERGRRALRVHLDGDVDKGLAVLGAAIEQAMA
jgi:transaldolase/glucose-6-phosphate isomerase